MIKGFLDIIMFYFNYISCDGVSFYFSLMIGLGNIELTYIVSVYTDLENIFISIQTDVIKKRH